MSLKGNAHMVVNLGCEMLFILDQRLKAQDVAPDKGAKVLEDVLRTMLDPGFLQDRLAAPQELYSVSATRRIFDRLAHSSIMRLSESRWAARGVRSAAFCWQAGRAGGAASTPTPAGAAARPCSMDKLFDLMMMGYKYQLMCCTTLADMLQVRRRGAALPAAVQRPRAAPGICPASRRACVCPGGRCGPAPAGQAGSEPRRLAPARRPQVSHRHLDGVRALVQPCGDAHMQQLLSAAEATLARSCALLTTGQLHQLRQTLLGFMQVGAGPGAGTGAPPQAVIAQRPTHAKLPAMPQLPQPLPGPASPGSLPPLPPAPTAAAAMPAGPRAQDKRVKVSLFLSEGIQTVTGRVVLPSPQSPAVGARGCRGVCACPPHAGMRPAEAARCALPTGAPAAHWAPSQPVAAGLAGHACGVCAWRW
jgi:hypothetical protein